MTAVATWSTDRLPREGAFAAWNRKAPDLHVPWAMSAPVRERFDAAVRYRKLDKLVVADFRGGGFTGRRLDWSAGNEHLVGVLMNLTGRLVCRYCGGSGRRAGAGGQGASCHQGAAAHRGESGRPGAVRLVDRRRARRVVRTLQVAFAETGTTVGRWIRNRRLKVCYRELAGAGSARTVTDVAFRWGFNDVAHFSRAFQQAFGVTPSSVLAMREAGVAG